MSEFKNLMTLGFTEARGQIGVPVVIGMGSVTGMLTPGPFNLTMQDVGEEINVDQSVDVLTSDLTTLGLSLAGLVDSCSARTAITVDGVACVLVAFGEESADATTKLYLKIAR